MAHARLRKILADGGYQGDLVLWTKNKFGWELEVVLRPKEIQCNI